MAEKLYRSPQGIGRQFPSRNEKRNEMNPESELSMYSSSSSSSTYLDISREYPIPPKKGRIRTFFTAPSERRRVRKQRSRRILSLGNSSSSSVNTDLAYGTGFLKVKKSRIRKSRSRRDKEKRRSSNPDVAIAALGVGLAAAARRQHVEDLRSSRRTEIFNNTGRRSRNSHEIESGIHSPQNSRGHDEVIVEEEDWESASGDESEASSYVDSTLAFGDDYVSPRARRDVVDPRLFGPANSLRGYVTEPVGFGHVDPDTVGILSPSQLRSERYDETRFTDRDYQSSSVTRRQPLQTVFPVPTSDPTRFEATRGSVVSAEEPLVVRPGPVPLQQPQPITPVSQVIYNQSSEVNVPSERRPSSYGKSIAGAALAGMAGAAIGSMIAKDRSDGRKSGSESDREDRRKSKGKEKDRSDHRSKRSDRDEAKSKKSSKRDSRDSKSDREEKRREKRAESPPKDKREKRRDSEREEDAEERRARRREERRAERSRIGDYDISRNTGAVESSVAREPIDPFQFQVAEDAFQTPDISKAIEAADSRRGRDPSPTVVTVEREPDFSRMRDRGYDIPYEVEPIRRDEHSADAAVSTAFAAQVAAVAAAGGFRPTRSERRRGERRGSRTYYERRAESVNAEDEQDRMIQEDADRAYRESVIARKAASRVIRERSPSPDAVDKYRKSGHDDAEEVRILTPPGMEGKKLSGPYDAPNADFELDRIMDPTEFKTFSVPQITMGSPIVDSYQSPIRTDYDSSRFDAILGRRPLLTLVRPTPTPSPAPFKETTSPERVESPPPSEKRQQQRSRSHSVDDFVIDNRGNVKEIEGPTASTFSKAVTWGPNETKHYDVESPGSNREEFMSSPPGENSKPAPSESQKKSSGWGMVAGAIMGAAAGIAGSERSSSPKSQQNKDKEQRGYRSVAARPDESEPWDRQRPPATGPKPSDNSMPGSFADDVDFTATLAAGLQDSGFDPNIVIDDPSYRKRTSPPGSDEDFGSPYRRPFAETVTDLGDVPRISSREGRDRGVYDENDRIQDPQAEDKFPRSEEFSPKHSKQEHKRRDKQSRQQSVGRTDARFAEAPPPSMPLVPEPESYAESTKLSKKEQKKRDKAADRRDSGPVERSSPVAETMPNREVFAEPESYFEPVKKSKSKKSKRSSLVNEGEGETSRYEEDRKISIPIDTFDEIINTHAGTPDTTTNEWDSPVEERKRKSKRDSKRYESPSQEITRNTSLHEAGPDPAAFPLPMSTMSDPEPADFPLPASTASELSRTAYVDEAIRNRSFRDSGIFDPSDKEIRSIVTAGADNEEPRKSKKKSRSSRREDDEDTKSVASAPAYDDYENSKKGKKKSRSSSRFDDEDTRSVASAPTYDPEDGKKSKKNGFFGLFGISSSKSESGKPRDGSPKAAATVLEEPKKKRKSKRSSLADGSDLYENAGPESTIDSPRADSSHRGLDDDDDDDRRSGRRRHRSKEEKRKSTQDDKDSFLVRAGTLGAGVGLAGAAVAYAAHHLQSEATNTNPDGTDLIRNRSPAASEARLDDPEISQRPFRPSIDPQYGDLLPLPPSEPPSPCDSPGPEDLPQLPDSRPDTPESERRIAREKHTLSVRKAETTPLKSPSQSAVPIRFVLNNRSTPTSPDENRSFVGLPFGTNSDTSSTPRSRIRPTSWDSTKEFKPLYLVEHNRHGSAGGQVALNEPQSIVKQIENEGIPMSAQPEEAADAQNLGHTRPEFSSEPAATNTNEVHSSEGQKDVQSVQTDTPPSQKHDLRSTDEGSPTPKQKREESLEISAARDKALDALVGTQSENIEDSTPVQDSVRNDDALEQIPADKALDTDIKAASLMPSPEEVPSQNQSPTIALEQDVSAEQHNSGVTGPEVADEEALITSKKGKKNKKKNRASIAGPSTPIESATTDFDSQPVTDTIADLNTEVESRETALGNPMQEQPPANEPAAISSKSKKAKKKEKKAAASLEQEDSISASPQAETDQSAPAIEPPESKVLPLNDPLGEKLSQDFDNDQASELKTDNESSTGQKPTSQPEASLDGLAAGYKEDQLTLARQLQEEFGSGSSKKSRKGKKKSQSGSQTPDVSTPLRAESSYFDDSQARDRGIDQSAPQTPTQAIEPSTPTISESQPALDSKEGEMHAALTQPLPTTPSGDGFASGYNEDQLVLAKQLQEEFAVKPKPSKKDKKRKSLLRSSTNDGSDPGSLDEAPQSNSSWAAETPDLAESTKNDDMEEGFATSKKSKNKKKRQSQLQSESATDPIIGTTPSVEPEASQDAAIVEPANESFSSKKSKKDKKKRQSQLQSEAASSIQEDMQVDPATGPIGIAAERELATDSTKEISPDDSNKGGEMPQSQRDDALTSQSTEQVIENPAEQLVLPTEAPIVGEPEMLGSADVNFPAENPITAQPTEPAAVDPAEEFSPVTKKSKKDKKKRKSQQQSPVGEGSLPDTKNTAAPSFESISNVISEDPPAKDADLQKLEDDLNSKPAHSPKLNSSMPETSEHVASTGTTDIRLLEDDLKSEVPVIGEKLPEEQEKGASPDKSDDSKVFEGNFNDLDTSTRDQESIAQENTILVANQDSEIQKLEDDLNLDAKQSKEGDQQRMIIPARHDLDPAFTNPGESAVDNETMPATTQSGDLEDSKSKDPSAGSTSQSKKAKKKDKKKDKASQIQEASVDESIQSPIETDKWESMGVENDTGVENVSFATKGLEMSEDNGNAKVLEEPSQEASIPVTSETKQSSPADLPSELLSTEPPSESTKIQDNIPVTDSLQSTQQTVADEDVDFTSKKSKKDKKKRRSKDLDRELAAMNSAEGDSTTPIGHQDDSTPLLEQPNLSTGSGEDWDRTAEDDGSKISIPESSTRQEPISVTEAGYIPESSSPPASAPLPASTSQPEPSSLRESSPLPESIPLPESSPLVESTSQHESIPLTESSSLPESSSQPRFAPLPESSSFPEPEPLPGISSQSEASPVPEPNSQLDHSTEVSNTTKDPTPQPATEVNDPVSQTAPGATESVESPSEELAPQSGIPDDEIASTSKSKKDRKKKKSLDITGDSDMTGPATSPEMATSQNQEDLVATPVVEAFEDEPLKTPGKKSKKDKKKKRASVAFENLNEDTPSGPSTPTEIVQDEQNQGDVSFEPVVDPVSIEQPISANAEDDVEFSTSKKSKKDKKKKRSSVAFENVDSEDPTGPSTPTETKQEEQSRGDVSLEPVVDPAQAELPIPTPTEDDAGFYTSKKTKKDKKKKRASVVADPQTDDGMSSLTPPELTVEPSQIEGIQTSIDPVDDTINRQVLESQGEIPSLPMETEVKSIDSNQQPQIEAEPNSFIESGDFDTGAAQPIEQLSNTFSSQPNAEPLDSGSSTPTTSKKSKKDKKKKRASVLLDSQENDHVIGTSNPAEAFNQSDGDQVLQSLESAKEISIPDLGETTAETSNLESAQEHLPSESQKEELPLDFDSSTRNIQNLPVEELPKDDSIPVTVNTNAEASSFEHTSGPPNLEHQQDVPNESSNPEQSQNQSSEEFTKNSDVNPLEPSRFETLLSQTVEQPPSKFDDLLSQMPEEPKTSESPGTSEPSKLDNLLSQSMEPSNDTLPSSESALEVSKIDDLLDQSIIEPANDALPSPGKKSKKDKKKRKSGLNQQSDADYTGTSTPVEQELNTLPGVRSEDAPELPKDLSQDSGDTQNVQDPSSQTNAIPEDEFGLPTTKKSKKDKKKRKSGLNQLGDTSLSEPSTPIEAGPDTNLPEASGSSEFVEQRIDDFHQQEKLLSDEPQEQGIGEPKQEDQQMPSESMEQSNDDSHQQEKLLSSEPQEQSFDELLRKEQLMPSESVEKTSDNPLREDQQTPGDPVQNASDNPHQENTVPDQSITEVLTPVEESEANFVSGKKSKKDKKKRKSGLGQQDGLESSGTSTPIESAPETTLVKELQPSTAPEFSYEPSTSLEEKVFSQPTEQETTSSFSKDILPSASAELPAETVTPEENVPIQPIVEEKEFEPSTSKKSKKDKKKRKSGLSQQESADNTGTSTPIEQVFDTKVQDVTLPSQASEPLMPGEDEFGFSTGKKSKKDKKKKRATLDLSNDASAPSSPITAEKILEPEPPIDSNPPSSDSQDHDQPVVDEKEKALNEVTDIGALGLDDNAQTRADLPVTSDPEAIPMLSSISSTEPSTIIAPTATTNSDQLLSSETTVNPEPEHLSDPAILEAEVKDQTSFADPIEPVPVSDPVSSPKPIMEPLPELSISQLNPEPEVQNPAEEEWAPIPSKKSKKDKKKRKGTLETSGPSTPVEALPPVAEENEQSKEISLDTTDPGAGDPKDDFGISAGKKSKKDKKKLKSSDLPGDSEPSGTHALVVEPDSKLDQILPGDTKPSDAADAELSRNENDATSVPFLVEDSSQPVEEDWGFTGGRRLKKDKKKGKASKFSDEASGTSTPVVIDDQAQDTIGKNEELEQTAEQQDTEQSTQPDDEWGTPKSRKSKKDKKRKGLNSQEQTEPTITALPEPVLSEEINSEIPPSVGPSLVQDTKITPPVEELPASDSLTEKKQIPTDLEDGGRVTNEKSEVNDQKEDNLDRNQDDEFALTVQQNPLILSQPAIDTVPEHLQGETTTLEAPQKPEPPLSRDVYLETDTALDMPTPEADNSTSSNETKELAVDTSQNVELDEQPVVSPSEQPILENVEDSSASTGKLSKKDKKKRKSLLSAEPSTPDDSISRPDESSLRKELHITTGMSDSPKESPDASSEYNNLGRKTSKKSKKRGKSDVDSAAAKVISDELAVSSHEPTKDDSPSPMLEDINAPPLKRGHFELDADPDLATPDAEGVNPLLRAKLHRDRLEAIPESTTSKNDKVDDASSRLSNAAKLGAGAGLGVVAGLAAKFEGPNSDTKKAKKGKKKVIDRRSPHQDDLFDDPALWEGAERTPHVEPTTVTEAVADDGFWTSPTEASMREAAMGDDSPVLRSEDKSMKNPSMRGSGKEQSFSSQVEQIPELGDLKIPKRRDGNKNLESGLPAAQTNNPFQATSISNLSPVVEEHPQRVPSDNKDRQIPALDPNRDSTLVDESPVPPQRGFEHQYIRDSGVQLRDWSPSTAERKPEAVADQAIKRLSWPRINEDTETIDLARPREPSIKAELDKHIEDIAIGVAAATASRKSSPVRELSHVREHLRRTPSPRSLGLIEAPHISHSPNSLGIIPRLHTPEQSRAPSAASVRSIGSNFSSATPPLRRTNRQKSSDLRSLSQRSEAGSVKQAELSDAIEINKAPEQTPGGQVHVKDMADVYDGLGEGRIGSPISPTRPPSMRRRQSMKVLDLEAQLHQLAEENRMLSEGKTQAEQSLYTAQRAVATLADRDAEIDSLKQTIEWLHHEVSRLAEVNDGLTSANVTMGNQHNERYNILELQHNQTSKELEDLRQLHANTSGGMEGVEYQNTLEEKDKEIAQLYAELEAAKEQIRVLQRQILASKANDSEFLTVRDEDYFDSACQKLCGYVQQWVLRFSKFSDMRACRLTSEISNEKIVNRLDNAVLDGSEVDEYLADRVRRRDIFMSMTMMMVWEFVFTRYLFGMDREQRQKLKSLEKLLAEVGPQAAVHQWRATTLTLLSKREAFLRQREQDTEAVVQEIFNTLSEILPPPSQLEDQIQEQLRKVMKAAVDLSIDMRTQRAEYMMLPPLLPEYDANGDLAHKFPFNAALMNERSGDTTSNEELEQQGAVVRVVLFPLVVKKGDDRGEGDEEIVVCPAQVLVAKEHKRRSSGRLASGGHSGVMGGANASRLSMQSSMPGHSVVSRDGSPF